MFWAKIASVMMFLAVGIGAFGAHALRDKLTAHYLEIYRTGVLYHFVHGIALFIVAWLMNHSNDPRLNLAGTFFVAGIILFSGTLYVLALTQYKPLGAVAPLGGLSFMIGWLLIFISKLA